MVEANEGDTGDERTRLVYRGAEDGGEDAVQELRRVLDKSEGKFERCFAIGANH